MARDGAIQGARARRTDGVVPDAAEGPYGPRAQVPRVRAAPAAPMAATTRTTPLSSGSGVPSSASARCAALSWLPITLRWRKCDPGSNREGSTSTSRPHTEASHPSATAGSGAPPRRTTNAVTASASTMPTKMGNRTRSPIGWSTSRLSGMAAEADRISGARLTRPIGRTRAGRVGPAGSGVMGRSPGGRTRAIRTCRRPPGRW